MPEWQGKSKGNKLGYQIFVSVYRNLGIRATYFLLLFVALYFFLFSWKSTGHSYRYFRLRQQYPVLKSIFHVYKNYYVFGQTLIDKIVVLAGISNPFTFEADGIENLQEMTALNRGGILLSGHAGNWEIASHMLKDLNTKINVVMFDGEQRQIKDYLDEVSGDRSFKIIVIREDLSHVYEIGEALQKNELVCLHADRFVKDIKTTEKMFLGAPAKFPSGPFAIAAAFRAPVSFVYAFKENTVHYHLYSSPIIRYSELPGKREYTESLVNAFVGSFEKMIMKYPDQWFNYYNFWES
ncbi:MAG TPA: lipid A biosynthesis acyltransferase [Cyclobacteriaceae bacterium]|nr:lipid A biosynthesis acyltransferase [Cyclobacteriaceae bacterium]